jgi:hypothetical protein
MFGIEIEIFVKLKASIESSIRAKRRSREPVPKYFEDWRDDLGNDTQDIKLRIQQRICVGKCIKALIARELGANNHGWRAEIDGTLHQEELTVPPEPRKWCTYLTYL